MLKLLSYVMKPFTPRVIPPKRSIPAILKEKNIRKRIIDTLTILFRENHKALSKLFKPFEDLTILSSLATLITLNAVILNENKVGSTDMRESSAIEKSNRFQLSRK